MATVTEPRFLSAEERAARVAAMPCIRWHLSCDRGGYGHIWADGQCRQASRHIYQQTLGPIPPGFQIDHLCSNRACVNPLHLEAVTPRENTLRSAAITAQQARQTHCKRGHPFTDANTYRPPGTRNRVCRACRALRRRRGQEAGR